MFYPIQNPQLFNEDFKQYVAYTEHQIEIFEPFIMCIWTMKAEGNLKVDYVNTILPDGCIDIIIDFDGEVIGVTGTGKATLTQAPIHKIDCIGVRFRPGAIYEIFGKPAHTFIDTWIDFNSVSKDQTLYRIFSQPGEKECFDFLVNQLHTMVEKIADCSWIEAIDIIYDGNIETEFTEFKQKLHYSDKTIERLFMKHYGYSPLALINILRLHKSLSSLTDTTQTLTSLSQDLGFYDSAHFSNEIKKYCGISPQEFISQIST